MVLIARLACPAYTYDTANRLASVSRPDIGTFGFTYNPDGQLLTITRPNGVTSTQTEPPWV